MNISTEQKIVAGSPIFIAVSGMISAEAAKLGFTLSQGSIRDIFMAGSATAIAAVVKYLHGRQNPELMKLYGAGEQIVAEAEKLDPSLKADVEAKVQEAQATIIAELPAIVPPAADPAPATPLPQQVPGPTG